MGSIPRIIGHGSTFIVSKIGDKTVLKGYGHIVTKAGCRQSAGWSSEDRPEREDTVYQHFGSHPLILDSFGLEEIVHFLRLEMAPFGCIKVHTQITLGSVVLPLLKLQDPSPPGVRLRMAVDVARALSCVHSRGVLTCDLSCRNIFLAPDSRIKIGDFSCALLRGHGFKHDQCYEGRYQLPLRGGAAFSISTR